MSMRNAFVVLALVGLAACKEEPAPSTQPEPPPSASGPVRLDFKGRLNMRQPPLATPRMDPVAVKEHRVDLCYFSTLTLRYARDSYYASLGKDEPSEKKLPSFGASLAQKAPSASVSPAPAPAPIAAPSAVAGASAQPAASAAPSALAQVPYERNARTCAVAVNLKDRLAPDIERILPDVSAAALDLAQTIAVANTYYQGGEYKGDKFAKGKELHKALGEKFAKFDDVSQKLGDAIVAWHKDHAADAAALDAGRKPANSAIEAARSSMLALAAKRLDAGSTKSLVEKLDAATTELKAYGDANAADTWAKMLVPSLTGYAQSAKDALAKPGVEKNGLAPVDFLVAVNAFTALLEANQRATSRSLVSKGQTTGGEMPRAITVPPSSAPAASAP